LSRFCGRERRGSPQAFRRSQFAQAETFFPQAGENLFLYYSGPFRKIITCDAKHPQMP
jgi:hypothetical protein